MSSSEAKDNESAKGVKNQVPADLLNRVIARAIDFLIVLALFEVVPKIGFFTGIAYLLIADGLFRGRSVGKRLVGLHVIYTDVFDNVKDCGYRESVLRNSPFAAGIILYKIVDMIPLLGGILSFLIIVGVLVFESLVMVGSEKKMRLGDELAETLVVEDRHGRIDV